jgi:hypothetical protein
MAIHCKPTAKMETNFAVCVKILGVILKSILEFKI